MTDGKIGVFICKGYGIAEALDVDALTALAEKECKADFVRAAWTCEREDLASIQRDIRENELKGVVIAGIAPRYYEDPFPAMGVMVERVPLRDHVVWCQPPNDEDTQMMAADYLRMAIAKVRTATLPEPFELDLLVDETILVVGGGVAGISAALEASLAGYPVRLVEKSDRLGGRLAAQHKSIPTRAPFRELEDTGVEDMLSTLKSRDNVLIYTGAVTRRIEGGPGCFEVTLAMKNGEDETDEKTETFRVGAIVQATGWTPTDPRNRLLYGALEDVIRNVDLESMVKITGRIVRPSDGKAVRSIAFVQCGGSRQPEHKPYCSAVCCLAALKQALYLRALGQENRAFVFYEFMRTPGLYEDFYRRVQEDDGVFFVRGQVLDVRRAPNGGLLVRAQNDLLGEEIEVAVDLVVVAAGMCPNSADGEAIRALRDATVAGQKAESEIERNKAAETVDALRCHEGTEILGLDYRQGPDLPMLEYGFPDSHFICFPYESRRTGIYIAGALRMPMDGLSSREDGAGAALKAIQCIEMTSRGEAVHPRAKDVSYPELMLQRCTLCKRCTEECPFGVLNEDEKGTPLVHVTRCRRCGICMGACPERIVSFKDYSVEMVAAMIKAVEIPDEFEEKPRILALLCENDAYAAMDLMGAKRLRYSPYIRIIPVRCLGSVNVAWIKEAISVGFDGVILGGCKYGDDYQCHFIKGSELAASRGENIKKTLAQMSMENERVELHQLEITDYEKLQQIFDDFEARIEEIGMNPFKGM